MTPNGNIRHVLHAVNSNKNFCIYYISICFYNCQNRTAVKPLVPHRSICCYHSEPIYTLYLYIFITVRTAPKLNYLFRTAQPAVTIRNLSLNDPILLIIRSDMWHVSEILKCSHSFIT